MTYYPGTPRERLALNTFIKLTRAVNSLGSRLSERGSLDGLSETQFGVMETLLHLGPMCQAAIGGKLLKSGGNITLVIDNLEKRGLVLRQRDPHDRRRSVVTLTDTGRECIQTIFPQHLVSIVDEMNVLSPEEQERLGELCRKLGTGARHSPREATSLIP